MSQNPEEFFASVKESVQKEKAEHDALSEVEEWDPKPNPSTLRGYFMKAERILTKYGPRYKAFIKDYDTDLTISVFCSSKLLREGILDASPKKGTLIVFEYDGEHKSQRGFSYGGYYVRAQESDPEYWAALTTPKPGEEEELRRRQEMNEAASAPISGANADDIF